jgi:hypothetical protein
LPDVIAVLAGAAAQAAEVLVLSLLFLGSLGGSPEVVVIFNSPYGQYSYNNNGDMYEGWNNLMPDFVVTVDGTPVTITNVNGMSGVNLRISGSYTVGQTYVVKVVYTANPARKITAIDYYSNPTVVGSFTVEKTVQFKNY